MGKSIATFVASLLVIIILVTVTITGFNLGVVDIPSAQEGIRLGLDLRGGSAITFQADGVENPSEEDMEIAQTILRRRLDDKGLSEATVQIVGANRLYVEIPDIDDPNEAIALLGKTAELTFCDADGNIGLNGNDIKEASSAYGQLEQGGPHQYYVKLTLKDEAISKFATITKNAANRSADGTNYVAILLDGEIQSAPSVGAEYAETGINSAEVTITVGAGGELGETSAEYATNLANIINSGRLPFALKDIETRSVGPTLGAEALETSLLAALIGIILVIIFMIVMYRLPGVVASIALVFYTAIVVIILAAFNINLSLPGIAGIILSIGMAVDANVVIFERIKDELRSGKTLKASIDAGFKRAVSAVIDSNVTTLIAAVVLGYFGTGTVQGFAWTLGIGVVVSLFTAVFVTRFLLKQLVGMNIKSLKAYGA